LDSSDGWLESKHSFDIKIVIDQIKVYSKYTDNVLEGLVYHPGRYNAGHRKCQLFCSIALGSQYINSASSEWLTFSMFRLMVMMEFARNDDSRSVICSLNPDE